jgi:hypothetical protein
MKTLQEKVQGMLEGETKRRETALKFVNEISEILQPIAKDIWGEGAEPHTNIVWLSRKEKDKREYTDFYFRYDEHKTRDGWEYNGFYYDPNSSGVWGKDIIDLRGTEFWVAIRTIIEWIPYIAELIDSRSESREQLLAKINL